jgi:TolB protein
MKLSRPLLLASVAVTLFALACGGDDSANYSGEPTGHIFFTTDRDGNTEIYSMAVDGSDEVNLTNDPGQDDSPDVNGTADHIAFISTRNGAQDVWVMDIDGGNPTARTNDPAADASPIWSPDSTKIAHYSARSTEQGLLWVTDVESGNGGPLLDSITPSTPDVACSGGVPAGWLDAETVLYQGTQGDIRAGQVCAVTTAGADIKVIYSKDGTALLEPALSPDGKTLVFASDANGNLDIYVVGIDGIDAKRLTIDPGPDSTPAWSPDGQWIVFSSERTGDAEIYIMRPDGSDVRQVTDNAAEDTTPVWAP